MIEDDVSPRYGYLRSGRPQYTRMAPPPPPPLQHASKPHGNILSKLVTRTFQFFRSKQSDKHHHQYYNQQQQQHHYSPMRAGGGQLLRAHPLQQDGGMLSSDGFGGSDHAIVNVSMAFSAEKNDSADYWLSNGELCNEQRDHASEEQYGKQDYGDQAYYALLDEQQSSDIDQENIYFDPYDEPGAIPSGATIVNDNGRACTMMQDDKEFASPTFSTPSIPKLDAALKAISNSKRNSISGPPPPPAQQQQQPVQGFNSQAKDANAASETSWANDVLQASKASNESWKNDQALMSAGSYTFHARFSEKYRLEQILGEGSFGFVWIAERLRDSRKVAAKFIYRQKIPSSAWTFDVELGMVPLEVHFTRILVHPNIIQFLDHFDDGRYVYLITELHGTSWTWSNPKLSVERNLGLRSPAKLASLVKFNASLGANGGEGHGGADPAALLQGKRCAPCDLFECIEAHFQLPEKTIYHIFAQLYDTVMFLKSCGLVHRDLKDENIVIDEDYNIKVVDFGSASWIPTSNHQSDSCGGGNDRSRFVSVDRCGGSSISPSDSAIEMRPIESRSVSMDAGHGESAKPGGGYGGQPGVGYESEGLFERFNGTLAFAAPEIIRGMRYRPLEAEVWTLGILLYTMVFKESPFPDANAILNAPLQFPYTEEVPGMFDLIQRMLQRSPEQRIKLDHIGRHPWIVSHQPRASH